MAHSIQVVGGKHEIFDDGDLIAVICLMGQALESHPNEYGGLRQPVTEWQENLKTYGPGTIELSLESLVSSADVVGQLLAFLEVVEDEIERFGKTVPALVLNERSRAPGVTFNDYPTALLARTVVRLRALVV